MTYEEERASPDAEQKLKERLDENLLSRAVRISSSVKRRAGSRFSPFMSVLPPLPGTRKRPGGASQR